MAVDRFFPFPRAYSGLDELYAKEILKWTGARNVRLKVQSEGHFLFEDICNPSNQEFSRFVGLVDPLSDIDVNNLSQNTVFFVDDDEKTGKLIVIATDGANGTGLDLFQRTMHYYRL